MAMNWPLILGNCCWQWKLLARVVDQKCSRFLKRIYKSNRWSVRSYHDFPMKFAWKGGLQVQEAYVIRNYFDEENDDRLEILFRFPYPKRYIYRWNTTIGSQYMIQVESLQRPSGHVAIWHCQYPSVRGTIMKPVRPPPTRSDGEAVHALHLILRVFWKPCQKI